MGIALIRACLDRRIPSWKEWYILSEIPINELPLIVLTRFRKDEAGTYGYIESGKFRCFTVECPDLGNVPWLSCIPEGVYLVKRGMFSRGNPPYKNLELQGVPNRSAIEIHAANEPQQLAGCIAPQEFLKWNGDLLIGRNSKHTLQILLESFTGDNAWMLVRSQT